MSAVSLGAQVPFAFPVCEDAQDWQEREHALLQQKSFLHEALIHCAFAVHAVPVASLGTHMPVPVLQYAAAEQLVSDEQRGVHAFELQTYPVTQSLREPVLQG